MNKIQTFCLSSIESQANFDLNQIEKTFIINSIFCFNLKGLVLQNCDLNKMVSRLVMTFTNLESNIPISFLYGVFMNRERDFFFNYIGNVNNVNTEVSACKFSDDLLKEEEALYVLWRNKTISKILINGNEI